MVLQSASVERVGVSTMQDFFLQTRVNPMESWLTKAGLANPVYTFHCLHSTIRAQCQVWKICVYCFYFFTDVGILKLFKVGPHISPHARRFFKFSTVPNLINMQSRHFQKYSAIRPKLPGSKFKQV